jgi:hypothetical protein
VSIETGPLRRAFSLPVRTRYRASTERWHVRLYLPPSGGRSSQRQAFELNQSGERGFVHRRETHQTGIQTFQLFLRERVEVDAPDALIGGTALQPTNRISAARGSELAPISQHVKRQKQALGEFVQRCYEKPRELAIPRLAPRGSC